MKVKKILGILLALCFVLSVTAAAVSAAPVNDKYDGKQKYDSKQKYDGKQKYDAKNKYDSKNNYNDKKYDNNYGKKKYFMQGHWGHKKVKHNKDKKHKSFWYTFDKYWIPGYWYWK